MHVGMRCVAAMALVTLAILGGAVKGADAQGVTLAANDDWEGGGYWELTGYPGAVANAQRPSYEAGIAVLDDDSDGDAVELEHHGDATAGDSGGPFFGFWGDGFPYVIGTVSGGENISGGFLGIGNEDNNICAGGKAMVDMINWARNAWP